MGLLFSRVVFRGFLFSEVVFIGTFQDFFGLKFQRVFRGLLFSGVVFRGNFQKTCFQGIFILRRFSKGSF